MELVKYMPPYPTFNGISHLRIDGRDLVEEIGESDAAHLGLVDAPEAGGSPRGVGAGEILK